MSSPPGSASADTPCTCRRRCWRGRPPAALVSRRVVARPPPPRAPVPFDRQVQAIQQNGGRPLARADLARLQPPTPVAPVRLVAAGGAVVGAGALAHGAGSARPSNPPTPQ